MNKYLILCSIIFLMLLFVGLSFQLSKEMKKCGEKDELLFVFNMDRLNEKNISFADFQEITYMNLENIWFECPKNIQDCFVYETVEDCR